MKRAAYVVRRKDTGEFRRPTSRDWTSFDKAKLFSTKAAASAARVSIGGYWGPGVDCEVLPVEVYLGSPADHWTEENGGARRGGGMPIVRGTVTDGG